MYCDIFLRFSNGAKVARTLGADSMSLQLNNLLPDLEQILNVVEGVQHIQHENVITNVHVKHRSSTNPAAGVDFVNICGTISHFPCEILLPGVLPYFESCSNSFGISRKLYSRLGNMTVNREQSIYRGFRSTADVETFLEHAIMQEKVRCNTLHMIVASAHLDHRVFVHSYTLEQFLSKESQNDDPRWSAAAVCCHDDVHPVKIINLSNFRQAWLQQYDATDIKRVQITIGSKGLVNMFMSMNSDTHFTSGYESRLVLFCDFFLRIIHEYT